jgi:spermidine synthase
MAQRPGAGKVLLIGGGISGTAKEILKYGVEEVDYVELDPLILEFGRKFLPDKLNAPQIQTINADGRLYLKQADDEYDVIIIDVPDPSTAQLNRFYTAECFAAGKQALSEDGVLAFSLGHYENYLSPELARLLASARRSVATAFAHVLMIPGGRVFFLASDAPIFTNIARRIEQERISTKLVNQHYLDAILTPDRRLDMERAAAQPAALNRDFSPMLYYYHLRHWLSQFRGGVGVLPVLLAALVCVCIVRLRGPALVLFASGFAGTSLEIVLLLAFQILCGSVYHQIGIIVTVFMAGLALGAASANRSLSRGAGFPPASPAGILAAPESGGQHARETRSRDGCVTAAKSLALLAFAIAAAAIVLPLLLPLLNHVGGTTLSLIFIKTAVALLTFGLAALVGLQFPLANRLESGDPVAGAARLYTADFLGAFLGALLVSAWLLPLLGVTGVCLLIAALNFIAGLGIQFRKVAS